MKRQYIIIGQTSDGVEHFINLSCPSDSWFKMAIRTLHYRHNAKFRARYKKIYMKCYSTEMFEEFIAQSNAAYC